MARTGHPVRFGVITVLLGLLGGACGVEGKVADREIRQSRTTAIPALGSNVDIPDLVVASGSDVYRYEDGILSKVGSVDYEAAAIRPGEAAVAIDAGDGSIIAQREYDGSERYSELVRLRNGTVKPLQTPPAARVYLFERALIGTSKLLFATERDSSEFARTDNWGDLWLYDVATRATSGVTQAFGPEFFTGRASYGAGIVALTRAAI